MTILLNITLIMNLLKHLPLQIIVFSILNLNIRGISENINKLKEYLDIIKHNFSITTIQETWFTEDTCLEYYNLPNIA